MKFTLLLAALLPVAVSAAEPARVSLEEAVAQTLATHPGVELRRVRLAGAEGALQQASGQFDWGTSLRLSESTRRTPAMGAFPGGSVFDLIDFTSLNNLLALINQDPITPPAGAPSFDHQREEQRSFSFGFSRQLRNGIVVIPSATVSDYRVNTYSSPLVLRSEWGVQFIVPLARGRGRDATAADETAARLQISATRALARQEIADHVSRVVAAYWDCLAAEQRLAILADTEKRAQDLVQLIGDLVRLGELEPAVRLDADAESIRRRADVISGELALFTARQRLGVALGLTPEALPSAPLAAGDFPTVAPPPPESAPAAPLAQLALRERGDLFAAQEAERAAGVYLRQARTALRPRLDLDVRAGFAGATPGFSLNRYPSALSRNVDGLNLASSLSLDWPTANRSARGRLARNQAQLREATLSVAALSATIAADVAIAHAAWRTAALQYSLATRTAAALGEVLANQRRKLQLGETDLTALVQNEERYFQARSALISAARDHAVAVLDLRRVTGTLLSADAAAARLSLSQLTTPPNVPP